MGAGSPRRYAFPITLVVALSACGARSAAVEPAEVTSGAEASAPVTAPQPEEIPVAALARDAAVVAAGQEVYTRNCAACHGESPTGSIGPDLTDDEWLHGGEGQDILRTLRNGVPSQGMPRWDPILRPEALRQVAAYVYSLRGS